MPEENTTIMIDQIVNDMQVWDREDLLTWAQNARRDQLLGVGNHTLREIYRDCMLGDN